MDVIEHGTAAPSKRGRVAVVVTAVVVAVTGLGLYRLHNSDTTVAPSGLPTPTTTMYVLVLAHFSSDYSQGFDNGKFLLQYVLVNDNSRDVIATPLALPPTPGITASAVLLPAALLGRGDPPGLNGPVTSLTVPRGGRAVYALHGQAICTSRPADTDVPAQLEMDGKILELPLPTIGSRSWVAYLQEKACGSK